MLNTRLQGSHWETEAQRFLQRRGLKTVQQNFHGRFGEIDLVMLDGPTLVFVEVRYRSNARYGSGADSVTFAKQKKIIAAARRFLQCNKRHRERACRFDVISMGHKNGEVEVNWIRSAFDAG
jgi:putative endonuclease